MGLGVLALGSGVVALGIGVLALKALAIVGIGPGVLRVVPPPRIFYRCVFVFVL